MAHLDALDPDLNKSAYRKRCLQALRHLSTRHQVLPSSLMIQDVKREGHNTVGVDPQSGQEKYSNNLSHCES